MGCYNLFGEGGRRMKCIVFGTLVFLATGTVALSQDLAQHRAALKEIRETAIDICDKASQEGGLTDMHL